MDIRERLEEVNDFLKAAVKELRLGNPYVAAYNTFNAHSWLNGLLKDMDTNNVDRGTR